MQKKRTLKPIAAALGTTFAVALTASPVASAGENPFELSEFASGYMVAGDHEGACGEGKCGGDKAEGEGACGEGKCGGDKAEGEGACGGDKAEGEGACGGDKAEGEGKCGEGKCGGAA